MVEDNSETPTEGEASRISGGLPEDESAVAGLTSEFYRGEVDQMATWRSRLDQTTNWAVVVVATILTWAFSSPDNPHYVILIGVFGVSAFLGMETVRYREYDIWRNRVRILQQDLYAEMYSPEPSVTPTGRPNSARGSVIRGSSCHFEIALSECIRDYIIHVITYHTILRITIYYYRLINGEQGHSSRVVVLSESLLVAVCECLSRDRGARYRVHLIP